MKRITISRTITRAMAAISMIVVALLLMPGMFGVGNIKLEFTQEAAAAPTETGEGAQLVMSVDFVRILDSAPTFKDDFANGTDAAAIGTTVWDGVSGAPVYSGGRMKMVAANSTDYVYENLTMTGETAAFEMMYEAATLQSTDNTTLKIENSTSGDYVQAGNRAGIFQVIYKNGATLNYYNSTSTFSAATWYIVSIYINSNDSIDVEFRYKNFTLIDSEYISPTGSNIDSAADVKQMWVNCSEGTAGGATSNDYRIEYVWADAADNTGASPASDVAAFAPLKPQTESHIWKPAKSADVDDEAIIDTLDNSTTNTTGGSNATAALTAIDPDQPTSLSEATYSDTDSVYDKTDIGHIAALTHEKNETYKHRELYAYEFSDTSMDNEFTTAVMEQFGIDGGSVVDYRINNITVHFAYSADLVDAIKNDFADGVKNGDADINAGWFSNSVDTLTGSASAVENAVGDGLDAVHTGSVGAFGAFYGGASDILTSGWGGFTGGMRTAFSDGLLMTNAMISSAISGAKEFVFSVSNMLLNAAGKLITAPFSLLFGGTVSKIMIIVLVIAFVTILAIMQWKWGIFTPYINRLFKALNGGRKRVIH